MKHSVFPLVSVQVWHGEPGNLHAYNFEAQNLLLLLLLFISTAKTYFIFCNIVMGSEQPIHKKTPAGCSAGDSEDNDEMKEMLGIMVFPFVSVQVWHREPGNMHP